MMKVTIEQFEKWLKRQEDVDLEFKESTSKFSNDRGSLFDYCAALANGHGGKLVLGVCDKSREVTGTSFSKGTHAKLSHEIWERLKIHVDVEEFEYQGKRVLIFHIPRHPTAMRVKSGGKGDKYTYPIRRGESLGEMDDQKTREILNEAQSDFTSNIVSGITLRDLDPQAIDVFRQKWAKKTKRGEYSTFDNEKVLRNTGLMDLNGITFAALILVGKEDVLRKYLPDAEIIFEWRNDPKQVHHDFRKNWRAPFVSIDDDVWNTINARNLRIPFQEGFFQREVWAFDENSIREAVHNAVMPRDYSIKGRSIFIKASSQDFLIESPGCFPLGITLENVLSERVWRNRVLAEGFEKIGFAERSGQGLDDIFGQTIRDGKGLPDLSQSDSHTVRLSIPAQVKDTNFILYLERISNERQINLSFEKIYELERIRENQRIERPEFKDEFLKLGIIESIGKGRGTKYILSNRYYEVIGQSGKHTRLKGLSREQIKELILNHIREGKPSTVESLLTGFSECKPKDLSNILQELKADGKVYYEGRRPRGMWRAVN